MCKAWVVPNPASPVTEFRTERRQPEGEKRDGSLGGRRQDEHRTRRGKRRHGSIILAPVDREAMARNQRRRMIGEAVELEQGREAALLEQLEETVAELEGPRIDEEAFAHMTPEDADVVRTVLAGRNPGEEIPEDEPDEDWLALEADPEAESQELLAEITRLKEEIARSQRRRDAFERYMDALDG